MPATDDANTLARLHTALEALRLGSSTFAHARVNELALRPGGERLRLIEPVGYLDMLVLQRNARVVLTTDSAVRIVEILADTVETRAHRR